MAKILTDALTYAKAIKLMGMRGNCKNVDFSQIDVPEEVEAELKKAAETSYGTEVTPEDMQHINCLTDRVIQLLEYRAELAKYLKVGVCRRGCVGRRAVLCGGIFLLHCGVVVGGGWWCTSRMIKLFMQGDLCFRFML